jgi:4-hydroxy-2-oxoheptanedioate aldolase
MGKRSNGPIRAAMYGEASSYQATANNEILIIPMIETQQGIDNIDEILSVPGISGIYIGPSDMGLSLGMIPILDREEPVILGIYEKLLASCKTHGKFAGLHNGTAAYAARMLQMGFRFVTIANDSGLMARAAREAVAATRKAAGDVANSTGGTGLMAPPLPPQWSQAIKQRRRDVALGKRRDNCYDPFVREFRPLRHL